MRLIMDLAGGLTARAGAALGGMFLSLVVGHYYGSEALGKFTIFIGVLGGLSMIAKRGLDLLLTRSVAKVRHRNGGESALSLLAPSIRVSIAGALALSVPGMLLLGTRWLQVDSGVAVAVFPLCMIAIVVVMIVAGYIRGTEHAWLTPLMQIGGGSALAAIIVAGWVWGTGNRHIQYVFVLFTLATGLFCASAFLFQHLKQCISEWEWPGLRLDEKTCHQNLGNYKEQFAFTVVALTMFITQAGSFSIAGPFLPTATTGVLRIAERLGLLVTFGALAIDPIIAARVVRYREGGRWDKLRRLTFKSCLAAVVMGVVPMLVLLLFPALLVKQIGHGFMEAVPYIRALALTNIIVAALGPFSMVMNMANRERQLMWISITALTFAVVAYPVSSLLWGGWGFIFTYATVSVGRSLVIAMYGYVATRRPSMTCQQGA